MEKAQEQTRIWYKQFNLKYSKTEALTKIRTIQL